MLGVCQKETHLQKLPCQIESKSNSAGIEEIKKCYQLNMLDFRNYYISELECLPQTFSMYSFEIKSTKVTQDASFAQLQATLCPSEQCQWTDKISYTHNLLFFPTDFLVLQQNYCFIENG